MPPTEGDLQRYISDAVEESLTLDYKAAASLGRTDAKKKEITKDVSAMANAAGGRIIYGLKEFADPAKRHLAEVIDPIDRNDLTKEWLEQVISGIRPRVPDLIIHSVQLASGANHVAYVVDVPQGNTAHQASDFRYYRRYNFESVPMHDHEVRDVMGRMQHPRIAIGLEFAISAIEYQPSPVSSGVRREDHYVLRITAQNIGSVLAKYVNGFLICPIDMIEESDRRKYLIFRENGRRFAEIPFDNEHRDLVDWNNSNPMFQRPIYGPGRYLPLLPRLAKELKGITVDGRGTDSVRPHDTLRWTVHADNAPPEQGEVRIADVPIRDER